MDSVRTRLLAALLAVTLWSTNAYAADVALQRMTLSWLLLVQFGTAAVALLAIRSAHRVHRGTGSSSAQAGAGRMALLVGVVGLTGTVFLQYLAFATAPIVAANVLTYGWPLLAAGWIAATRRSRHALRSAGLALTGFGGVVLIVTGSGHTTSDGRGATWGYLAALGSAACMAMYTLGASRLPVTSTGLLVPAALTGTGFAAVLTLLTDNASPTVTGVLAAAYIGLGPMAAGFALWTRAMSGGGAERLSPLGYATPLLSTVLLLATGASATAATLTGVALVLACSVGALAQVQYDGSAEHRTTPGSGRVDGCGPAEAQGEQEAPGCPRQ